MNDLNFKQQILDTKSPSFCAAKWYNATIWLGSGMTTSCHHPPAHPIPREGLDENPKLIHNTAQKKQDRDQMQRGQRPPGCDYCWKIEDIGRDNISDRVYKSKIYRIEDLNRAYSTPAEQDVDLKTLEISFDRTCNFACSYCNPGFSSTWVNDIKKNGPYQDLASDGRHHYTHTHDNAQISKPGESNPYVEAFFKWWESDLHRTLDELRITGGEPLMSGDTWRLLEWFSSHDTDMRFAINSNLGAKQELIDRLISYTQRIRRFHLYTSNESVGVQAEYIRDGLVWSDWVKNMERMLSSGKLEGLHVMCTINALCLESLPRFLDLLVSWKSQQGGRYPNFTLNILRFPSFQSPLVLDDDLRTMYGGELETWLETNRSRSPLSQMEINQVQRLIDYLDVVKTPHGEGFDRDRLQHDFKSFYQQYDRRRGKDFVTAFPRMAQWYQTLR